MTTRSCRRRSRYAPLAAAALLGLIGRSTEAAPSSVWRGVHLMAPDSSRLSAVEQAIRGPLSALGVNVIVFEINYNFAWQAHPELALPGALTKEQARRLVNACREKKIRLIPLFNCLGHQSWAKKTFPLLTQYPEFDETPRIPRDNPDIYCRSWCPQHPEVNRVVFKLLDELLDAFQADALHVGLDEVFLIGHEQCSRCRGKNPAELFARAVNDYHRHLVGERRVEMLLWGDRLLDDATMKYGEWESSRNGTAAAIDLIPKDIIICDWHYERRDAYPSVPHFLGKGFRCWPSSWRNREAAVAFLDDARRHSSDRLLGHLCTTWVGADQIASVLANPNAESEQLKTAREVVVAMRACLEKLAGASQ